LIRGKRSTFEALAFLHCDGYKNHSQTDFRTYTDNSELTFANRYSVRNWTHDTVEIKDGFIDDETYNKFIEEVIATIHTIMLVVLTK
jgi:hypothetical protein